MRQVKQKEGQQGALPVVRSQVAGVDIGSQQHWVCGPRRGSGTANVRCFGTTTSDLEELIQWLVAQKVESVAMESTSVYWIPLYEMLESKGIEVVLANARQLRSVPGRKTDMRDCQWIQTLHSCGLLKGSFRPNESLCALRTLQRQCANLIADRTRALQWMQKSLDQMNVQVHRAVTHMSGETGMAIIRAICAGERDPDALAALRNKRCKKSHQEIAKHLTGTWRKEHVFNLAMALRHYDALEHMIADYDQELQRLLTELTPDEHLDDDVPPNPNATKERAIQRSGQAPLRDNLVRLAGVDLTRIDGINVSAAKVVITEVGTDLSAFPFENNLVSWLKLCPKTPISGGKPLRKRTKGMGSTRVAGVLRMAALSLSRSKSALGAYYRRIARRKDGATAVFATARKLAILIFRALKYGQAYVDIGQEAFESRFRKRRLASLAASAADLGYRLVPETTDLVSG